MNETKRKRLFSVDREKRNARRREIRTVKRTHSFKKEDGSRAEINREVETNFERAEGLQIVQEMTQAFIGTVEFYKTEMGGSMPHDKAVTETLERNEWRRGAVQNLQPKEVSWGNIAAVGEVSMEDSLKLWVRVREAADNELESGKRAADVAGYNTEPFTLAQFMAIRDSFADQWQPQGGIESAMIDMMTVAFSLQMYWSTIAHNRATKEHNEQKKAIERYESGGWKSPYQSEANAIDQAFRLADGYNRQFLRVLRQLRDLRRYSPVVIQNNGGQVNLATDGAQQQVNVQQPK